METINYNFENETSKHLINSGTHAGIALAEFVNAFNSFMSQNGKHSSTPSIEEFTEAHERLTNKYGPIWMGPLGGAAFALRFGNITEAEIEAILASVGIKPIEETKNSDGKEAENGNGDEESKSAFAKWSEEQTKRMGEWVSGLNKIGATDDDINCFISAINSISSLSKKFNQNSNKE